ncbi:MAG: 2-dehydropantoate 2-reductase [Bacteroidota bacterium]|nr:2-dehydropantoate 2-reductase [Bacteroidota bacterium]MDP4233220.1 2-dehydropantoate 2-reductase [Bacteroidota bacterium]MDP4242161.1 2-dehydropantoate 2-reductase [Bacteroidota bacterium]MDP4287811.1 2-dehydropantoate 2-reductase [Bacteroidota bacterium]
MEQTQMGEPKRKQIAVVGLGPVGQILAVHLQEAAQQANGEEFDVLLCDLDKARMHLIQKEGIELSGVMRKKATFEHLFTSVRDLLAVKPDIIVFCVKAYHLAGLIREMADFPRAGTLFISVQNGIDTELELAEAFGESNTFRMVVNYAGNHRAPNVIGVSFFNPPNYIASIDDSKTEEARWWADLLSSVHLDTLAVDSFEILRRVWEKTILNSSLSALCGVAQMNMKEVMALPDMVDIIEQVIMESIAIAKAENIHFEVNFIRHCMRYLRKSGSHFPSLAVDLMHKRPTEIDYLNGKFVEYGKKHYLPTPMHLAFTNMVKAITQKSLAVQGAAPVRPSIQRGQFALPNIPAEANGQSGKYYLGVDLGSAYTKIVVINDQRDVLYHEVVKTLTRDKKPLANTLDEVRDRFPIHTICATGYGREQFPGADVTKTEIHCAARGVFQLTGAGSNIIDIGAEDIKIITIDKSGAVKHFYMNSKCASGTGAFLTEMAEKVEIPIDEMSKLAALSSTAKELNSFCTVFAKTEVMKWSFDQVPIEDIARGVYLSLANRIHKLKTDSDLPIVLAGGVIAYHPFLRTLLAERFQKPVSIVSNPQFCVAFGAALFAQRHANIQPVSPTQAPTSVATVTSCPDEKSSIPLPILTEATA